MFSTTCRQKTGLCKESASKSERILIKVCASCGACDVEYVIFDKSESSTVSGALGVKVFRGFCVVRVSR